MELNKGKDGKRMGQRDLYQSDFYEDKERFADVFNGVLFGGREVMKPEELNTEDSVMVSVGGSGKGKKVICDKMRKWKGRYVSVMVLESQSYVDYRMVLRVMESEVIGYDKQRKEANRKNLEAGIKLEGDEYPSGMKKGQKFTPIITLVLYVGRDKIWDGERSLYGMLDLEDELKPFVNDFKLNLFDYHDYKNFDMFKTANRYLFEVLSCGKDLKKMRNILKENISYKELDVDTAKAIAGVLKLKINLDGIARINEEGKEVYDMCQAFEDYKEEGRREGKREGELIALKAATKNLMKNQKVTFETAAKMLGISKNKQKELLS